MAANQVSALLSGLLLTFAVYSQQQSDLLEPESATQALALPTANASPVQVKQLSAKKHMIVTANPYASNAGLKILQDGGNAADAMVIVQTILGLVEPQSSGLGGGAFALYFDSESENITAYDGRETAPLKASSDLFLQEDQRPMAFFDAVVGGRSVGTPGTVAILSHIHKKHGSKPWRELLQPAIELAEQGFVVSPRLAGAIEKDRSRLISDTEAHDYFLPDGEPLKAGVVVKNQAYANALKQIATEGADAFYQGKVAKDIVTKVQSANNPGSLSVNDFTNYKVIERKPVCTEFLAYEVCGMGPPSSGAQAVNQILRLSEFAQLRNYAPESPVAWQIISDATRLAFADRNLYLADPAFFKVPDWLLKPAYLKQRASLIKSGKPLSEAPAGRFDDVSISSLLPGQLIEQPSTTHFTIVDESGNVLSSTSTIENGFGSRLMVHGFLLNNELTDFSFAYQSEKGLIANRVEPGKRPRSSMAPTIVMENNKPVLAIGSPGGSRIINYVANSLIRTLMWKQAPYDAINGPHISNRFGQMDLEQDRFSDDSIRAFETMGYKVAQRDLNSGLHVIHIDRDSNTLVGAADLRREGHVAGE